jgi:hypothetical protein
MVAGMLFESTAKALMFSPARSLRGVQKLPDVALLNAPENVPA